MRLKSFQDEESFFSWCKDAQVCVVSWLTKSFALTSFADTHSHHAKTFTVVMHSHHPLLWFAVFVNNVPWKMSVNDAGEVSAVFEWRLEQCLLMLAVWMMSMNAHRVMMSVWNLWTARRPPTDVCGVSAVCEWCISKRKLISLKLPLSLSSPIVRETRSR